MSKLDGLLKAGASDDKIVETIKEARLICNRCITISKRELMEMISPSVVENLVTTGMLYAEKFLVETRERRGGIADIVEQIKAEIKNLSPQQLQKITEVEQLHYQKLEILHKEREDLIKQLTSYFSTEKLKRIHHDVASSNTMTTGKLELIDLVSAAGLMEHLRQSFNSEAEQWNKTLDLILDETLTVRQLAQFYIYCEFQHSSVQQLSMFWSVLNKDWENNQRSWSSQK